LVQRRAEASPDGWFFPELKPGGADGKRSWYIGKRFALFRSKVLRESRHVDFQSLRRTFAT
jgi:hypothetical protein